MIRLFVIEDHVTVIVSSLRFLFRPQRDGIQITGFAASVEEATEIADPELIDLFILDLYIPGHKPIENIRKLKAKFPDKSIAIYTSESSAIWRNRMIEEGAIAYITKDSTRDELKLAILKAFKGETVFFGKFPQVEQSNPASAPFKGPITLTPVQHQIVKYLSEGISQKEIAKLTGMSLSLIQKILNKIRASVKVKNNLELISLLSQSGEI
jgi:DNA-binding NarL/FixJ family response regulator